MQASEPARLCLLLYLASYAVRRSTELGASLNGLVKPLFVVGAAAVLLLAEPDFGATVVLGATSLTVLFVGGARLRDLLLAVLVGGTRADGARVLGRLSRRAAHVVPRSLGRSVRHAAFS